MLKMTFEVIERVYNGNWFFNSFSTRGFVQYYPSAGGGDFISKFVGINQGNVCKYIYDIEEFNKAAEFAADKLLNDHKWRSSIYKKIDFYTEKYFAAGEKLRKMPFSDMSNKHIIKVLKEIIPLQQNHHVYSIIVNGPVIDARNHLSNKIHDELKQRIGQSNLEKYWSTLTLVTEMSTRQKKDYEIALLAEKAGKIPKKEIDKKIKGLYERYCWLDYLYQGPPASFEQYKKELGAAVQHNTNLSLPGQLDGTKKQQQELMSKLGFDDKARFLVELAQTVIRQKSYRKDVQYHGMYCYEPLFRELAKRNNTDWKTFASLFPWEIEHFILKNRSSISELEQRKEYSCFIVNKDRIEIKLGEEAREFSKTLNLDEQLLDLKEAKGICAYLGKTTGRVKIIHSPEEMDKLNHGDILVSQATSPDLLPAMEKAAAFVTNTGGLICHAAITSRELKVPCIVGTGNATQIFRDGDFVEVDAEKGIVRLLERRQ